MNGKPCSPQPFDVLLVEDNDDDVLLTRNAFKKLSVAVELHVARDGLEALKFLRHEAPYEHTRLPHVILLDLNMPRMDGMRLLAALKQDDQLRIIPTIILSTSATDDDVANAYQSHASAYMTKPMDVNEFTYRTKCFASFWLSDVTILPTAVKAG